MSETQTSTDETRTDTDACMFPGCEERVTAIIYRRKKEGIEKVACCRLHRGLVAPSWKKCGRWQDTGNFFDISDGSLQAALDNERSRGRQMSAPGMSPRSIQRKEPSPRFRDDKEIRYGPGPDAEKWRKAQ